MLHQTNTQTHTNATPEGPEATKAVARLSAVLVIITRCWKACECVRRSVCLCLCAQLSVWTCLCTRASISVVRIAFFQTDHLARVPAMKGFEKAGLFQTCSFHSTFRTNQEFGVLVSIKPNEAKLLSSCHTSHKHTNTHRVVGRGAGIRLSACGAPSLRHTSTFPPFSASNSHANTPRTCWRSNPIKGPHRCV